MHNPFETLDNRLSSIETLLAQTLPLLQQQASAAHPENGGIELAQQVTRLSKPRIYALVSARANPPPKRGNKLYFNRADLMAWVNAGKRGENDTAGRA